MVFIEMDKIILYSKILLLAVMQIISCQRLSSTLLEGDHACPGARVNFTCMTGGSLVIAWRSDEYIGPNGAGLEFTSADGVGSRMTSSINSSTFATLVRINGSRVVESVLTLTVLDSYQTASVTCSEVGRGASTITFTLLAIPGIPQNVTANMIASTSDDCVILLQWMPPIVAESSVNHYVIDSSSGRFITRDTSVEIALLIHHCNRNTYIKIHAVDYCDRDGPSYNDLLGLLLTNTTLPPVTESKYAIDNTQSSGLSQQKCSINIAAIVGGVLGGVITGIIIALSVALCIWVVCNRMPVVGHLRREQLEEVLRVHQETGTESRIASDSSSEPKSTARIYKPDKKLKKMLYVVRSKDIHDISRQSLLMNVDPDDDDCTTDT